MRIVCARAVRFSIVAIVLAWLAACSSDDVGPSANKVIADTTELVRVSDMNIDRRKVIAEDRIEYELALARGVHFRGGQFPMDWPQVRLRGKKRITVLYRRKAGGVWTMTQMWPTGKGRNPPLDVLQ